jgi:hypothetical protein
MAMARNEAIKQTQQENPYILTRDGNEVYRGTYNECLIKLHRIQGASWHHAMKYEGYRITAKGE